MDLIINVFGVRTFSFLFNFTVELRVYPFLFKVVPILGKYFLFLLPLWWQFFLETF